jgi:hypothetical protein
VSKYLINKFLLDRDRTRRALPGRRAGRSPGGRRSRPPAAQLPGAERGTWLEFTGDEQEALATHDYVSCSSWALLTSPCSSRC